MRFLLWYLWVAPHILLGVALAVFLRRGLRKQFPFFLTYVVFDLFNFLTLIAADVLVLWDSGGPFSLQPRPPAFLAKLPCGNRRRFWNTRVCGVVGCRIAVSIRRSRLRCH